MNRKPLAPMPTRGTQSKVPMSIWIDPHDKERVEALARRRDIPASVFARKLLMYAASVAEQQDALDTQPAMRATGRL
jgi:hypothetical protein